MEWSTACPDWERRLIERRSIVPVGALFPAEAEAALEVFKAFRVVDVQGAPTVGEIARPWILDFATAFFGAYDPQTGRRLIRTFFLKVSKKNWKSGIAAFLMGTLLVRNWRETGEFGIVAPTTEIANNSFGPLKSAIAKDEELADLLHVQPHTRTITHRTTKATLQVVAAESDTVGGKKFGVTLIDELWLFGKRANADGMLQEATGGQASRDEGGVIYLTTESDDPPAGVYLAKNVYARKVRDGEIVDPTFLPVLYEWPRAMVDRKEHLDLANAYITNPNLGASVSEDFLRSTYAEKQAESARAFQVFCAKHLNVEVGVGVGTDKWAGVDFWERQARQGLTLDALLERCDVATVGADGGGLKDLYGLCVLGRDRETGELLAWFKAFAHPSVLEYHKQQAARFKDFEKDGDLVIVQRVRDDIEEIAAIIKRVDEAGLFERPSDGEQAVIGVDRNGIDDTLDELEAAGIPMDKVKGISQGWALMSAITTAERRLAGRELWHSGSRLMNWCVGNAKTERKGNALMVTKEASGGGGKIDPLMALFNAVALMSRVPAATRSFWESAPKAEEAAAA